MLGTPMLRHTADYYPKMPMMDDHMAMPTYDDQDQMHQDEMHQDQMPISPLSTMFVLPNMRAPHFEKRSQGPVQIYKFPAVVGPNNKVAMVTGMAF